MQTDDFDQRLVLIGNQFPRGNCFPLVEDFIGKPIYIFLGNGLADIFHQKCLLPLQFFF